MKNLFLVLSLSAACLADKPSPQYVASQPAQAQAKQDTYGSPEAPPEAAPTPDSYGAPKAPVVDSYGSPQAPVVKEDGYGAPSAPVISKPAQAAPVGNQGYYYYYYPVKQGGQPLEAEAQEGGGGLFGGLSDGLLGTLVTKKILLVVLGIGAFLLVTALGIQVNFGRSFSSSAWDIAEPYMTEDNLITLADFVMNAITKYK